MAQQKTPGCPAPVDQAPHRDALGHSLGDAVDLQLCKLGLGLVGAHGIRIRLRRHDAPSDRLAQPHGRAVDLAAPLPVDVAQRKPGIHGDRAVLGRVRFGG